MIFAKQNDVEKKYNLHRLLDIEDFLIENPKPVLFFPKGEISDEELEFEKSFKGEFD